MKLQIILGVCIILGLLVLFGGSRNYGSQGEPINSTLTGVTINSSSTVSSTVKQVIAAFTGRQLLSVSNNGNADVWLSATSTSLQQGFSGTGLYLKASTTQVFSGDTLWTGAYFGISNGTTTLSFFQL